jgi:hypothetical protein
MRSAKPKSAWALSLHHHYLTNYCSILIWLTSRSNAALSILQSSAAPPAPAISIGRIRLFGVNGVSCAPNGEGESQASTQSGRVPMSNADQFWELARELRWAAHSKTKKERKALIELARKWTRAALIAERALTR